MISPERFSECTLVVSKFWALGPGLEQEEELMITKRVLCPSRLRLVPNQFSWVDHRLVREKYIQRSGPEGLALYLLLVTVCDGQGLSYYSDKTVARLLNLSVSAVARARHELMDAELIAYESPLYQVLSLDRWAGPKEHNPKNKGMVHIGELLEHITGGER